MFLSTSLTLALSTAVIVPLYVASTMRKYELKKEKKRRASGVSQATDDLPTTLEKAEWEECSAKFHDCPWKFSGCQSVGDAIESIWEAAQDSPELIKAKDVLKKRTSRLWIARIAEARVGRIRFMVVYRLETGSELFGGEPLESPDFDVSSAPGDTEGVVRRVGSTGSKWSDGLKQRIATAMTRNSSSESAIELPCISLFQRVHDGFGVVLNAGHLIELCENPCSSINGSCFYVYPTRGFEFAGRKKYLVKFGRIDKDCVACVDTRVKDQARVVYVERSGVQTEDEETPLAFVVDTVFNIAGERPLEPHMYGAALRSSASVGLTTI
jgi:hypothetical protein